jgi:hypothetical protein
MSNSATQEAYAILEFPPNTTHASTDEIRAKYRLCALKYHPDKYKGEDAHDRFCKIREAHDYLMKHTPEHFNLFPERTTANGDDVAMDYQSLLGASISVLFGNLGDTEITRKLIRLAISKIVGLCEKSATEYVKRLDVVTLGKLYEVIYQYKDAFHLSEQWLSSVKNILYEKTQGEQCVILNPFLEDLQANNLYKITESGKTYIVPLWHPELVYDNSGADFTVRCCPVLPDNIEIDQDNNICVRLEYTLSELWENTTICVPIGTSAVSFSPCALNITKTPQTICIPNAGISRINRHDMFDISKRSSVYLAITITGIL